MSENPGITDMIQDTAARLPRTVIDELAAAFSLDSGSDFQRVRRQIANTIREPHVRSQLYQLVDQWEQHHPRLPGSAIGLALQSANAAYEDQRERAAVELVWTGPIIHEVNFRRTENALLSVIEGATHSLHIVSFAIYKAKRILDALSHSLDRGLSVSIYLESPHDSDDKVRFDPRLGLGNKLNREANIYVWPLEKRQVSPEGQHGSLHAKAAVADAATLFVSSANLTDYAMSLNIELGVVIHNAAAAAKVETQLHHMIENGDFVAV